jgi:hypothetical protein
MTVADTPSREEKMSLAIKAIEGWQRNRMTTFTPSNILQDFGDEILDALRLAAKPADDGVREALNGLAGWCAQERSSIGAVDGYDYRSGEEFGIRRVEIEIEKRARALSPKAKP